jgi:predicted DNA-binding antitoxin AbrB/MazE fold protein
MNKCMAAIFDHGVFRPVEEVDLPTGTHADVIVCQESLNSLDRRENQWPADYFAGTSGALTSEEFERFTQG